MTAVARSAVMVVVGAMGSTVTAAGYRSDGGDSGNKDKDDSKDNSGKSGEHGDNNGGGASHLCLFFQAQAGPSS